jgi:hypothetical protein
MTLHWREVVKAIAGLSTKETTIDQVARRTLENVHLTFQQLKNDPGIYSAFAFLVALSVAGRSERPAFELLRLGVSVPDRPTPLALVKALHTWVDQSASSPRNERPDSLEYRQLARGAAADAIGQWTERNAQEVLLFELPPDPYSAWRQSSTGAGFCELSRLYFSKLTERYLRYFLEREASAAIPIFRDRDAFQEELRSHVDKISRHAFETAKITQSFSAGWFNKHTRQGFPPRGVIDGFIAHSLGKIQEELLREGEAR